MRRKGPCDWAWRNNEQFICGDQEEVHVAKPRGCASLPRLFLVVTMFLRKLGSQVSCRVRMEEELLETGGEMRKYKSVLGKCMMIAGQHGRPKLRLVLMNLQSTWHDYVIL